MINIHSIHRARGQPDPLRTQGLAQTPDPQRRVCPHRPPAPSQPLGAIWGEAVYAHSSQGPCMGLTMARVVLARVGVCAHVQVPKKGKH